jgi:hypothetical protein
MLVTMARFHTRGSLYAGPQRANPKGDVHSYRLFVVHAQQSVEHGKKVPGELSLTQSLQRFLAAET